MDKDYLPELDEHGFMVHLADLKKGYQRTLRNLQARRNELLETIGNDEHLAVEYEDDLEHIKGMISDVNFTIEWLHTGRHPGTRRGIDRRSVYQNTVLMDPAIMEQYIKPVNSRSASTLTENEQDKLRDALAQLAPREREVFIMAKGEGFPHEYIADLLNIHKGSVDVMVKRAHEKLSREWQGTLF